MSESKNDKNDIRVTFMPIGQTFKFARVIPFNSIVLIGRVTETTSQARNNLRFDNKTVSRNHAQMWMEDGKFYIADTKSTGGTFLNGKRLSEQGKESDPFEVHHNDIVALGQDVTDKSGFVEHKRVEMKVLFNSQIKPDEVPHDDDDEVDYGSVSEVKVQVDTEFNTIWNNLTQGIDNPLKRLREIMLQNGMFDFTPLHAAASLASSVNNCADTTVAKVVREDNTVGKVINTPLQPLPTTAASTNTLSSPSNANAGGTISPRTSVASAPGTPVPQHIAHPHPPPSPSISTAQPSPALATSPTRAKGPIVSFGENKSPTSPTSPTKPT